MEKAKKTAKGLFALWVVSYLAFSIYISWAEVFHKFDPANFTSGFHLLLLGFAALYLLPLMWAVRHYAKLAALEKLGKISAFCLFVLGLWCVFFLICVVLAHVAPETFAAIIG